MKSNSSGFAPNHEDAGNRVRQSFDDSNEETEGNHLPETLSAEQNVEPRYVHPDALELFKRFPKLRRAPVFGMACEAYGPKSVLSISVAELLSKGIVNSMINFSRFPMFRRRFGVDATVYQRLAGVSKLGWSLKALLALVSDTFSLFGYTKRWYMAIACVVGSAMLLAYGLLPPQPSSAPVAAAFIFLASFSVAAVDIMSQGHYSRLMRRVPEAGPSLIGFIWWLITLGSIVAAAIQGPLADAKKEQVAVFISAGLQLMVTTIFLFNWYGERKNYEDRAEDAMILRKIALKSEAEKKKWKNPELPTANDKLSDDLRREPVVAVVPSLENEEGNLLTTEVTEDEEVPPLPTCCFGIIEINSEVVRRNWRLAAFCALMTIGVVALTVVTILGTRWQLLWASIAIWVALCSFGFYALPLAIAKAALYIYLHNVTYIQIPGALDSFYTAGPDCVPDGPNFPFVFYNTVAHIIGNAAGFVGVTLFTLVFAKRTYRLTYIVTTAVLILASIFDLIIVERWNRPHVSDYAVYILGDSIVYEVCSMLNGMPGVVLLSRLCPRGSESMMFALLAGYSNLGSGMANTIGSLLMEFKWPVESDPAKGCDFSNVKWLLIVGHILLPLVNIPLVFILIPRARMDQELDARGKAIKPEGVKTIFEDSEESNPPSVSKNVVVLKE